MDPYSLSVRPGRRYEEDKDQSIDLKMQLLLSEVSSSQTDIDRAMSPYGQNRDPIARAKGLKIYTEMMDDDQVKVCVELRKQAVLSTQWSVDAAEAGNRTAEEYADFIRHCLVRMDGTVEDDLEDIYSAIEYGFSVTEINFKYLEDGPFSGKVGLASLKTREPYNYDFKQDYWGNLLGIVYTGVVPRAEQENGARETMRTGMNILPSYRNVGQPLERGHLGSVENPFPTDKFIIYSYNKRFGNFYGRSDLISAFRYWNAKRFVLKFWNVWLERYASPFTWAEYDPNSITKKGTLDDIDDFLKNLSARSGIRVPKGVLLHVEGTKGSAAGGDSYEKTVEAYNRYISHGIFTPNLLGFVGQQGSGGAGGSFALGKKHFEAFMWIVQKTSKDTSETIMGEQLIRRLIEINYPNPDLDLLPKFTLKDIDDGAVETRARILTMLSAAGFINPEEEWVREYVSLPKKDPNVVLAKPGMEEEKEDGEKEKKEEFRSFDDRRLAKAFEQKVDFKGLEKELDSAEESFAADAAFVISEARAAFVEMVKKRKVIESGDPEEIRRLTINLGELKKVVAAWMAKLHLDSKLRALEELGRSGVKVEVRKNFAALTLQAWAPLPPAEASDFFNDKVRAVITTKGGKKVVIAIGSKEELAYYDERAFAVTGVVRDDILNDAKQAILTGIRKQDVSGTIDAIEDIFSEYVGHGVDPDVMEPGRLATIVRTNTVEAMNQGRRAMYEDPDVKGFVPYFQYSAVMDARTTDYCRCMDGKIFDLSEISGMVPPAHYNCRSITVPVTLVDVDEAGGKVKVSDPCADRMLGFSDHLNPPIGTTTVEVKPDTDPVSKTGTSVPEVVPTPKQIYPTVRDLPPAPKSAADIDAQKRLKDELSQIISACPYSGCHSPKIIMTRKIMNIGEYRCEKCELPFRISNRGDVYLFDPGVERWERATQGIMPSFFSARRK